MPVVINHNNQHKKNPCGSDKEPPPDDVFTPATPSGGGIIHGTKTFPVTVSNTASWLKATASNISGIPVVAIVNVSFQLDTVPPVNLGQSGPIDIVEDMPHVFTSREHGTMGPPGNVTYLVTISVINGANVGVAYCGIVASGSQ